MEKKNEILFAPFPKQLEFLEAVFSEKYQFILYGGAIRGGKTYALLALFILLSKIYPRSRWAIVRRDLPTIKKNTYPSWDKIKPENFIKKHDKELHTVTFNNDSQIIFFPESYDTDKDLNRWKGFEVNGVGFEEINECQRATLSKAFERAGSYIIKGTNKQPPPIVVATANPCFNWLKDEVYTPHREGRLNPKWLYIHSCIEDNIPLTTAQPLYLQSLKDNLTRYEYEVFVEGNWDLQIKTGSEFYRGFELDKHVKHIAIDDSIFHVSIDSNVFPYIAISIFQFSKFGEQWHIKLVHEIPAKDPNNTAKRAAEQLVKWIKTQNYQQTKIFLYGDRSTQSRNNIDDAKRSFAQIFSENIELANIKVTNKMASNAPPVAALGDFVNAIFDGSQKFAEISISETCKTAINDYVETKIDKDGCVLKKRVTDSKTGISYEPNGHFVDNLKDIVYQAFTPEYNNFVKRRVNHDYTIGSTLISQFDS